MVNHWNYFLETLFSLGSLTIYENVWRRSVLALLSWKKNKHLLWMRAHHYELKIPFLKNLVYSDLDIWDCYEKKGDWRKVVELNLGNYLNYRVVRARLVTGKNFKAQVCRTSWRSREYAQLQEILSGHSNSVFSSNWLFIVSPNFRRTFQLGYGSLVFKSNADFTFIRIGNTYNIDFAYKRL